MSDKILNNIEENEKKIIVQESIEKLNTLDKNEEKIMVQESIGKLNILDKNVVEEESIEKLNVLDKNEDKKVPIEKIKISAENEDKEEIKVEEIIKTYNNLNKNEVQPKEGLDVKEIKQEPPKTWIKRHTALIVFISVLVVVFITIGIASIVGGVKGIKALGTFISNQVLGMKWLESLINKMFTGMFGAGFSASHWGGAIKFFIYDTIKIVFLLCILIFVISFIQSYFPPERTKKLLGRYKGVGANAMGALLGTLTPFCSCSSIPIFMGFTRAGISSGVTFSFLISSPLVDLGAFILLASVFGFPIAITYVAVGLVLAIIGGTIIQITGVGKNVREFITEGSIVEIDSIELTKKDRLIYSKDQMLGTLKKVWIYILIGVGIGATIHNFIPQSWIEAVLGQDKWYSAIVATLVGIPMYADIFGTIPVAEALFFKGVGVGTILAFMMSVTALSLPSMIMLSKAVKPKLLFWFIIIIVVGILIIGYSFNALKFLF